MCLKSPLSYNSQIIWKGVIACASPSHISLDPSVFYKRVRFILLLLLLTFVVVERMYFQPWKMMSILLLPGSLNFVQKQQWRVRRLSLFYRGCSLLLALSLSHFSKWVAYYDDSWMCIDLHKLLLLLKTCFHIGQPRHLVEPKVAINYKKDLENVWQPSLGRFSQNLACRPDMIHKSLIILLYFWLHAEKKEKK